MKVTIAQFNWFILKDRKKEIEIESKETDRVDNKKDYWVF